jgi:hypothetical protein
MAEYCIYAAGENAPKLNPPITAGDVVCVDCPSDGECKGSTDKTVSIRIQDKSGNKASVLMRLQQSTCGECPDVGKKGYSFQPPKGLYG